MNYSQIQPVILRDPDLARQYLLQGLWFQRAMHPSAATVTSALTWALTISDAGQPLPPTGFVVDLGHAALGRDREGRAHKENITIPGWPAGLARTYEDHVLGKLYADWTFERASDALKRIEPEKQGLGLAYIVKQFRERGGIGGVEMSPGIIRGLLTSAKADENLRLGWEMLSATGPLPLLVEIYEQIIAAARRMAEVLALEDVIALEQKTALLTMGEYVAHRQVVQMAARLEEGLPRHKVKPLSGRQEVPTRVLDEDSYPVGGFSSISTRGSVESLLHSQLAYMENDKERQPDMFDIKFLRDELYYYSRDENQFLRRRRSFLFVLQPELIQARFKDADLPCQRLVLVLALLLAAVRKLSDWLSTDSLRFEFLLVQDGEKQPLTEEGKLFTLLFRDEIANLTVNVQHLPASEVEKQIKEHARRSMCQCLIIGVKENGLNSQEAVVTEMVVDSSRPTVRIGREPLTAMEGDEPQDCWIQMLTRLLQIWV